MFVVRETGSAASSSAETVDLRQFAWSRGLVDDYINNFPRVASLFSGNSFRPDDWRSTVARVQRSAPSRNDLTDVLLKQLERRQAPRAAVDAASRFRNREAVAIVTGQQAGLFGGPLYSLLKAVTAIRLAEWVSDELRVPAVPVFWVENEDHDWQEIAHVEVLDDESQIREAKADAPVGAGHFPVCSFRIPPDDPAIASLESALPRTEFTEWLLHTLRRRYHAGASVSEAFAGWIEDVLGAHGLVVFEAHDPEAKPLAARIFVEELQHPGRTVELVRRRAEDMHRRGYEPQILPNEHSLPLFYLGVDGRQAIRRQGDGLLVGDRPVAFGDVRREASNNPERFSPNVLLRPVVQDTLFPTVCYVAGPAEFVYQAELMDVYAAFNVEAPLLHPRLSATIADGATVRFMRRYQLPFQCLHDDRDTILTRLMSQELPDGLESTFADVGRVIDEHAARIRALVLNLDPTLAGALDTTVARAQESFSALHRKAVQAATRKDDIVRRQLDRAHALIYPKGMPQERCLGGVFFLNRYGPALCERLLDVDPFTTNWHHMLTP
ncbi:MAG: bacillithiol biosynthesis cysteine-adding enzyme BshC [Acidobacteria bacterium]|nr:bacillithiol biosynthesis cysteine-adding enzyme BshC [Acidobacteriota bacterium]